MTDPAVAEEGPGQLAEGGYGFPAALCGSALWFLEHAGCHTRQTSDSKGFTVPGKQLESLEVLKYNML